MMSLGENNELQLTTNTQPMLSSILDHDLVPTPPPDPAFLLDCSQSPIFPWDFRDSNASIELPPSLFVRASATWGECLNYRGG